MSTSHAWVEGQRVDGNRTHNTNQRSVKVEALVPRRVLKFNAKKLTLIPPDRRSNPHFSAAIVRQCQCEFITRRQRDVAYYTGPYAGIVFHPSSARFIFPGQLTMNGDNHAVSRNPSLLVEISSNRSHWSTSLERGRSTHLLP